MSDDARDLLKGLLERKVSDRLGSGGASQLKRSRFFSVYGDFSGILRKTHEAEFIPPAATSMTDVRNFDKEFTSEPAAGKSPSMLSLFHAFLFCYFYWVFFLPN